MVIGSWRRHPPTSLRGRLRRTLLLFGTVAAALLAIGAVLIDESLERLVIQQALEAEAQHFDDDVGATAAAHRPIQTTILKDYFLPTAPARREAVDSARPPPPVIRALPPGFHESVSVADRQYYVYVVDRPAGRLFLAYDFTPLISREHWFTGLLAIVVGLILLGAYWIGQVAADRLSGPLEALAATLHGMDPHRRQARISEQRRDVELRQIAAAVNGYLARMDEFIDREQAFTQTVSHELRTPLASIRIALETLKAAHPTAGEPLQRLERASRQMNEIVDSLLALARGGPAWTSADQHCRVADVIREVIDSHQYQVAGRELTLATGQLEATEISASPRLLAIMIGNLVHNGIQNTRRGTVTVSLAAGRLVVEDTGVGLDPSPADALFRPGVRGRANNATGYGLGLYIVHRICERYGWTVNLAAVPAGGTRITVELAAAIS